MGHRESTCPHYQVPKVPLSPYQDWHTPTSQADRNHAFCTGQFFTPPQPPKRRRYGRWITLNQKYRSM
ncbi:hypothetical protein QQP08_022390 [Theobroma cacao]|uniref:Uncharacterized protein n=1 Tax=Theobroma cacao TaxID=3641 RepID=A0A061FLM2_THECC|nr:Uncharacterized protein TCM_034478 [Theobroma cacao]WRX29903.1 hypothetical protein QQP08_022390 [Theobroma cacao]